MRVFGDPIIIGDDLAGNDYEIIEFNGKHLKPEGQGVMHFSARISILLLAMPALN